MRRRISLYIGDLLADLSEDNIVLMTWQLTDLYNPSVLRNTYSQTVTLPGTAANNLIFGSFFRLDRTVGDGGDGIGPNFNPSQRTPFAIFNEMSEVLVSGYCKLTDVSMENGVPEYSVQFYGGLGSFLYGLSYKSNGEKLSLADLDYLGGGDSELDFVINATNVGNAWKRILGDNTQPEMWDVINFAPCLNGIPSDFGADKAVAKPGDVGLEPTIADPDSGTEYKASNTGGYCLINFPNELDEWAVKDLRSYLQRPVISFYKFMLAIADTDNNGGWTVDWSDISTSPYLRSWLTLPMLPSLGTFKQTSGGISISYNGGAWVALGTMLGSFTLADVPAGSDVTARLTVTPSFEVTGGPATLVTYKETMQTLSQQVLFLQAVAYASDGTTKVAASKVYTTYYANTQFSPEDLATACNFSPDGLNTEYASPEKEHSYGQSGNTYTRMRSMTLEVTGQNIASIRVYVTSYLVSSYISTGAVFSVAGGTNGYTQLFDGATAYNPDAAAMFNATGSATMTGAETLRSGAQITKQILLSTSQSPAEYLVSFCRMCGFAILADDKAKTVQILSRNTLYDGTTVDLTERVEKRSIGITPLAYDRKWYTLRQEQTDGAFAKEYKSITGREYGSQRIDTGYDFDAEEKDLLDGNALKTAVPVLDTNKYWSMLIEPVAVTGTITNSQYIADTGQISVAANTFNVLRIHITRSGLYTIGTNLTNPNYTVMAEYQDNTYAYKLRVVIGPGTYTTKDVYLTAGYYAVCSDGSNTNLTANGHILVPSPWLDSGNTYTLRDSDGNSLDTDISTPPSTVTPSQYNADYDNYDAVPKTEFRDAKNQPVDGADVLLMLDGSQTYARFVLTDDLPIMDTLNDGQPCWILGQNADGITLPVFNRYKISGGAVTDSLDFAVPRQVAIPGLTYAGSTTVSNRLWQAYLTDRLSVNGKVLRCKVDLRGFQVGNGLLRHFFFYGNAVWVLSKISNYSLTTYDLVDCEFIKVADTTNYTNGQTI